MQIFLGFRMTVSRCILAKWGLKEVYTFSKAARIVLFQGASSQNEDWKLLLSELNYFLIKVSRCILAKWGLKVVAHRQPGTEPVVSRCILAKWGLKVYLRVGEQRKEAMFQGASSQNEDWKPLIPAACPNSCLCFKALLAKWGLKDIILKSIYSFKKLLITLNWTMTDVLNFRMET